MNKTNKKSLRKRMWRQRELFIMLVPGLLFYLIFRYGPMFGLAIAFKDYSPFLGVLKSPWAGLKHFEKFFSNADVWRLTFNTLRLGVLQLVIEFPLTIAFAVILNEVQNMRCKKAYQTISYLPSFLSLVIICSIFKDLFSVDGVINQMIVQLGGNVIHFNGDPKFYLFIYILSDLWGGLGSGAIVYLAALSGVDQNLYEAAKLDGCSRIKMIRYISIPSIMPTIVTMFLLRVGNIIRITPDKTLLFYNDLTLETADIIGSYVYRVGITNKSYSFGSAVGLLESALAAVILIAANKICERATGSSLW
ncbi:MAG: sugar ABC transporter permease [Lachnospiraceae bacterium]|nr:sugar ABC transporter permease [Lachnospiraceae bacterium]